MVVGHTTPSNPNQDPLALLEVADPSLAREVRAGLQASDDSVSVDELTLLVSETIEALALATAFGQAVAQGFLRLVGRVGVDQVQRYARRLAVARREGAGLGQLLAEHLPAVLLEADAALLQAFDATLATLLTKGVYTLKGPLGQLSDLLAGGEKAAAFAFLDLLKTCFGLPLTYNRSIYMTQFLPHAVAGLDPRRRGYQIGQLRRVIQVDQRLAEPFMDGLAAGAARLSQAALTDFVSHALALNPGNGDAAGRALALEARSARVFCEGLSTSAALAAVRGQLGRYLQARLGRSVGILSQEGAPGAPHKGLVHSDGSHIYLPAECDHYPQKAGNTELYKALVRLEAACFEFGSFDFDLQRFNRLWAGDHLGGAADEGDAAEGRLDLERFFQTFTTPALAEALFNIFEHGRLRLATAARYPGLVRQLRPLLRGELERALARHTPSDLLLPLYATVALGVTDGAVGERGGDAWPWILTLMARAGEALAPGRPVEASARLVQAVYAEVEALLGGPVALGDDLLDRFWTPFGRRLRPELVRRAFAAHEGTARRVRRALAPRGVRVFQADLRRRLQRQEGFLAPGDLYELVLKARDETPSPGTPADIRLDLADLDLTTLLGNSGPSAAASPTTEGQLFRYPEWDAQLGEYLTRHTLVREQRLPEAGDPIYRRSLERHPGLVAKIRHAFELLKPQGLKQLRPWREGDSFDYRAMLDFAVDKRAGLMPSDRLYIKRIKHQRDVAVLLLVDLSRSTANRVEGSNETVLGITQSAIVLFCEALQVVGDRFAIAGFSGTGRLGVDYLRIKDFGDPLNPHVEARIAAMTPLRATRMGAAIRHATRRLGELPAAVRLLLVLGDGFPNDTEYKGLAAIADTRKAIQEARARQIHTKGITVNIGSDARLDDLYGRPHHTVIQDVRELPDRLFQIYGRLTRA